MRDRDNDPQRDLVLIGAALGAFGVRGEVRVRPFTAEPRAIAAYGPLLDKAGSLVLTPKQLRTVKDGFAITAPEVKDREAAEALKGVGLYVPRAALPPADDDEYYHIDLIGCRVVGLDEAVLGLVKAVQDFGAGELLEVTTPEGRSWFLPFTKAAVPVVDIAGRTLVTTEREPKVGKDDQPEGGD